MAIVRTPMIDDDGSGEVGTVINDAWKKEFYNQIDAALAGVGSVVTQAVTTTGLVTFAGDATDYLVTCTNAADITLSGVTSPAIPNGARLAILAKAAGKVFLTYGTGATAFLNFATSGPTPLAAGGIAYYLRSGGQWVLTAHEQGDWISLPFVAGEYTGMTITGAQQSRRAYRLSGRTLEIDLALEGITPAVGATMTVTNWPFTSASSVLRALGLSNVSSQTGGWGLLNASFAAKTLAVSRIDGTNFPATSAFLYFGVRYAVQ